MDHLSFFANPPHPNPISFAFLSLIPPPPFREKPVDYGEFEVAIRTKCREMGLEDVDDFVKKCIQLYETTVVRHGLMLVGPTMSGKTKVREKGGSDGGEGESKGGTG